MQPRDFGIGRLFWDIREAIVVGNADSGQIVLFNPAAEALFGYAAAEVVGQSLEVLIPERLRAAHRTGLDRYARSGHGPLVDAAAPIEVAGLARSGTELALELTLSPLQAPRHAGRFVLALLRDVTDRQRAAVAEALRRSEERYRAFVERSGEGIWRFELEQPVAVDAPEARQIEHWYTHAYLAECNDAMARMYGYARADEIVGARLEDFLPRANPDNLAYLTAFIRSGYRLEDAESQEVDREGTPRYFLNNLVGIVEDGLLARAWGTQRDVTERHRAASEREELLAREQAARAEAEAALRARDEFLSIAAHELRTPLTTALAHAQLLLHLAEREGAFDPERTTLSLGKVEAELRKLARLIEQLLDVSRIQAGKLVVEPAAIDLGELTRNAVEAARLRGGRHPITLRLAGPAPALADPLRLEQVLNNLLENAMKYSPDGGEIEVDVRPAAGGGGPAAGDGEPPAAGRRPPTADAVQVAVRDHGAGIPPDQRAGLFERYFQAHAGGHRSGMGLGLYISRRILELHGGTLEAEFPADGGTRFVARLPMARER